MYKKEAIVQKPSVNQSPRPVLDFLHPIPTLAPPSSILYGSLGMNLVFEHLGACDPCCVSCVDQEGTVSGLGLYL
jgi:hypothetical protein